MENSFSYRFHQLISLCLGTRLISLSIMLYALYVSTYFVFNQEENLKQFLFDFKIHSIIACAIMSIAAGGIINQFYDKEKDKVMKPFVYRMQHFLKDKYFFYLYVGLNLLSIVVSLFCSFQIFVFFLFYQVLMWFYSHKLNKLLIIANLSFVGLLMYPFFGILVYYHHLSYRLVLLAIFLFFVLFLFDLIKDLISYQADKLLNYKTIPLVFGFKAAKIIIIFVVMGIESVCLVFIRTIYPSGSMYIYFLCSLIFYALLLILVFSNKTQNWVLSLNLIRLFLFAGFVFMMVKNW